MPPSFLERKIMINFDNYMLNITKTYREAVVEAEIQIKNATYESLLKIAKESFSDGWVRASLWMDEHKGNLANKSFIEENLNAKDKEIEKIFGPDLKWSYQKKEEEQ